MGVKMSSTPPAERPFLAEFVGWWRPLHVAQGTENSPRTAILRWAGTTADGEKEHRELESGELFVKQDAPYSEAYQGSVSSKFCLVPRGKSAWSSRFFRVLFAGCVPVMLEHIKEDRCWYLYPPSALDFDSIKLQQGKLNTTCPEWRTQNAFLGVMRHLYRKKRKSKTSFSTFYLPWGTGGDVTYFDEEFRTVV